MGDDSDLKDEEGVSQKSEQELVKLYKRRLENWREVLIHLDALFSWEKPYYPGIIAGVVTFIFLMLWYFDPSVLTTLSLSGIIICILDYVVPILSSSFFDSSKWSGVQERKYEEICTSLVHGFLKAKGTFESIQHIKETKPYFYFIIIVGTLVTTAWIGNLIDNLFLTYMIVLFLSLLPGIKSQSLIQENVNQFIMMVKNMTGQGKKKK